MAHNHSFRERCVREGPEWLDKLLVCEYFSPCLVHKSAKPERNHFCIECNEGPICSLGLVSHHPDHQTLQIRKASHHDAIRVCDIQKIIDISGIQCYSINGAKIVFLLRPKAKLHQERSRRRCVSCKRALNDPGMLVCSINCKLRAVRDSLVHTNSSNNDNGLGNPVISLALSGSTIRRGHEKPTFSKCINFVCCCDGIPVSEPFKKRRIDNMKFQGSRNACPMVRDNVAVYNNIQVGNHDALFSPVTPDSVLPQALKPSSESSALNINPGHSPHSSQEHICHGCHCGERIRSVIGQKRPGFQISLPPLEDGELFSSQDVEQCKIEDHHQTYLHQQSFRLNRRKCIPQRSPFW